jgi:single-stranded DNA-binding protein
MSGEIPFYAAGNLTPDPELRFTAEGKPVAGLALAITPGTTTQPPSNGSTARRRTWT